MIRLSLSEAGGDAAVWSPDGTRITYHPTEGNRFDWRMANNTGSPERLVVSTASTGNVHAYFFSPSGTELIFEGEGGPDTGMDIGMVSLDGDGETNWLLREPYVQRHADLHPDGRWMAYRSDDSGRPEICVVPFPDVGDKLPVSNGGGTRPIWSRDGTELFYIVPGSPAQLYSATVEATDAGFTVVERAPILDWLYINESGGFSHV